MVRVSVVRCATRRSRTRRCATLEGSRSEDTALENRRGAQCPEDTTRLRVLVGHGCAGSSSVAGCSGKEAFRRTRSPEKIYGGR